MGDTTTTKRAGQNFSVIPDGGPPSTKKTTTQYIYIYTLTVRSQSKTGFAKSAAARTSEFFYDVLATVRIFPK